MPESSDHSSKQQFIRREGESKCQEQYFDLNEALGENKSERREAPNLRFKKYTCCKRGFCCWAENCLWFPPAREGIPRRLLGPPCCTCWSFCKYFSLWSGVISVLPRSCQSFKGIIISLHRYYFNIKTTNDTEHLPSHENLACHYYINMIWYY